MIYALGILNILCFLLIISVIAYVWTLKQGFGIRDSATEREKDQMNQRFHILEATSVSIREKMQSLADRPEAPAVELYRNCISEIEALGHIVRTVELKNRETIESVRRTQNKLAARTKRDDKDELAAQIEDLSSDGVSNEAVVSTRRQFGRVR